MTDLKCEASNGTGSPSAKGPKPGKRIDPPSSVTAFYEAVRLDNKLLALGNGYPHFHLGYYSSERMSHKDAALQMSELVCWKRKFKATTWFWTSGAEMAPFQ